MPFLGAAGKARLPQPGPLIRGRIAGLDRSRGYARKFLDDHGNYLSDVANIGIKRDPKSCFRQTGNQAEVAIIGDIFQKGAAQQPIDGQSYVITTLENFVFRVIQSVPSGSIIPTTNLLANFVPNKRRHLSM